MIYNPSQAAHPGSGAGLGSASPFPGTVLPSSRTPELTWETPSPFPSLRNGPSSPSRHVSAPNEGDRGQGIEVDEIRREFLTPIPYPLVRCEPVGSPDAQSVRDLIGRVPIHRRVT
jgi:hypothetical protein